MDEIILNETQKASAAKEALEFLYPYYYEKNIYQVERMSLEETKGNLNDTSVTLNLKLKIHTGLKIKMI